jgi:hypothetical protein
MLVHEQSQDLPIVQPFVISSFSRNSRTPRPLQLKQPQAMTFWGCFMVFLVNFSETGSNPGGFDAFGRELSGYQTGAEIGFHLRTSRFFSHHHPSACNTRQTPASDSSSPWLRGLYSLCPGGHVDPVAALVGLTLTPSSCWIPFFSWQAVRELSCLPVSTQVYIVC